MSIAALPLAVKLSCCGLLALCVALAYFGPAPARSVPRQTIAALLAGSVIAWGIGVAMVSARRPGWAALVVCLAVLCESLAAWMSRSRRGDGPPGPASSPPDEPAPEDWERFERAFRAYDRRRGRERTPA
ncbi:MAG TPA: hypothetical protein VGY97_11240 [Solirubrobacteraceae bacterium]|jgi:hypothetical protein|nr:hypothetical protein [Solirubrobacteraceae bacterium]